MSDQKMRFSCSNLARIDLDDNESSIVLLENAARRRSGKRVFTPPGGVVAATPEGVEYLVKKLGAHFKKVNQDGSADLRFHMSTTYLGDFEELFFSYDERREGLEEGTYRELREEFVDEEGILQDFPALQDIGFSVRLYAEERKETDKPGAEGVVTHRFYEVVDVAFPNGYVEQLLQAAEGGHPSLALVSKDRISQEAVPGGEIRDNALALVLDTETADSRDINVGGNQIIIYKNE